MKRAGLLLACVAFVLSCQSAASEPTCFDYLKSKGFEAPMFAQVRSGETVKNINDQIPALLKILHESEMIEERPVAPTFTISMQIGSSLASQAIAIQVGADGYGEISHVQEHAFFHCSRLPEFAETAFHQSDIVVR